MFFDLDNTLWDFETNSELAMLYVFRTYGLDKKGVDYKTFFEFYSRINHQLWKAYRIGQITKKELIVKRFQETFDNLNIKNIDPETMNSHYLGAMPEQTKLKPGAKELLDYLHNKKYKMYIITNGFSEVQYKKIVRSGLVSYFKKTFISEEIKVAKPGKEIFRYAVKSANAKKHESLMIGDDWESDIEGAAGFGIDSIYIPVNEADYLIRKQIPESGSSRIYVLKNISEAVGIL